MIATRNDADLAIMRESCRLAARIRDRVAAEARPGVSTLELSEFAGKLMREAGAESAFLGYHGYPGIICASVNDTVVHGIPNAKPIALGDVVSFDIGVRYRGYIGDTATTVMVGVTDPEVIRLVATAWQALEAGIAAARVGNRVSDISHAIERVAVAAGFGVVRDFVGHGVGQQMHEEPQIPNFGPPGRGPLLKAGMTLALEPMLNLGRPDVKVLDDGWTVVTRDGKPAVHVEHTIAVRDGEAEILTVGGN